jgi:L-alanine-DL-glutamate epimerase-like enolase superfamily enzyme
MKLSLQPTRVPLKAGWQSGHGTVRERELLLVRLEGEEGIVGHGEAAPLPDYDGVSLDDVRAGIEDCRAVLSDADDGARSDIVARCAEVTLLGPALAAIDLALWDLEGRRAGIPVWRLLGASSPSPVAVNWTIAAADRSGAVREAAEARTGGFRTLKIKVGLGDDHARVAAVRAFAGPEMKLRIDANGAWSPIEAEATLAALEPVGIELCEEPVSGLEAIGELAGRSEIPLALDESAADPMALDARVCPLMCLKIARCGGLTGLLETARRARAAGYEIFLASTLDGPLGIAAALHAAAVLEPARASGLATLGVFRGRPNPLPPFQGAISVPPGPGLGDGLLDWYRRY